MMLIAVGAWWTYAVIIWVMIMHEGGRDTKDRVLAIGFAVFWPIVAICAVPAMLYSACVASASRIRADLKNRGVLKEFDSWLRNRYKD